MVTLRKFSILIAVLSVIALLSACPKSGLVPGPEGELTERDIALDKYYQALRWSNNTVSNLMENIKLLPVESQQAWIMRADPIKNGIDTVLAAWKLSIDTGSYDELDAHRQDFKNMKNELLDLLFDIGKVIG